MRHSGNQGGRPRKIDRSTVALTTIRVQPSVLQMLNQLKKTHGFKDHNSIIKYYVNDNRAVFHSATTLRLMNTMPSDEQRIRRTAGSLNRKYCRIKSYR